MALPPMHHARLGAHVPAIDTPRLATFPRAIGLRLTSSLGVAAVLPGLLGGCASSSSNVRTDPGACGSPNDGPLILLTVDPRPIPPPSGGVIADGVYDLVAMVATEGDPRHTLPQTGLRLQIRFVTDQRAADHIEGSTLSIGGQVPQTECEVGRFATFGTTMRFSGTKRAKDLSYYTVTREGFIMYIGSNHGTYDPSYLVFRRR